MFEATLAKEERIWYLRCSLPMKYPAVNATTAGIAINAHCGIVLFSDLRCLSAEFSLGGKVFIDWRAAANVSTGVLGISKGSD
jgi:hypothetical protein